LKKVQNKFGGYKKPFYLCTRFGREAARRCGFRSFPTRRLRVLRENKKPKSLHSFKAACIFAFRFESEAKKEIEAQPGQRPLRRQDKGALRGAGKFIDTDVGR
jgi:hypothetical protein